MIPTKSKYQNLNKFNYHSQPLQELNMIYTMNFTNHESSKSKIKDKSLTNNSQTNRRNKKVQLISFQISQHGKSGVFFLQTQQGSFVLKSSNQIPQQYFSFQLACMLDISTPQMEILSCGQKRFHQMVFLIESYCQKDQCLLHRVKNKLDFPFYQITQYIPNITLKHMGRQKFKLYIDQSQKIQSMDSFSHHKMINSNNQTITLSQIVNYKLYQIGMCLGFDMIINNSDRFKLVWGNNNNGNIQNILIEVDIQTKQELQILRDRDLSANKNLRSPKDFKFIDHSPCLPDIKNPMVYQNTQKYFDRVCAFHLETISYLRKERQDLPNLYDINLNQQIDFYCQYRFNLDQKINIAQGIIYETDLFIQHMKQGHVKQLYQEMFKVTDKKQINKIMKQVKENQEKNDNKISKNNNHINAEELAYWNSFWNQEIQKLHLNFLELMYVKLQSIYVTYPELIDQIRKKVGKCLEEQRFRKQKIKIMSKNISKIPSKSGSQKNDDILSNNDEDKDFIKQDQNDNLKDLQQNKILKNRRWRQRLQAFKTFNYMQKHDDQNDS